MIPPSAMASGERTRWRRTWLVLLLAALLGSAALAFWLLRRDTPRPPEVDLAGTDPAVAAAIESVRTRVQRAPRDARAWGLLGMVLYAHEYAEESALCFRQAQRLDAREPRWPYFLGIALAPTDPEAALPALRRAVDLWGEGETAPRLRLANLLLSLGQVDEAEGQFQVVLRQAPSSTVAQLGLARVAVERNEPAVALKRLEGCLVDPLTQRPARSLRTELFYRRGDRAAAERERRLVERAPPPGDPPDPFLDEVLELAVGQLASISRADRLLRQGRTKECLAVLEETVREYPDSVTAWVSLGRACLEARQPRRAEEALRNALAREPGRVEGSNSLGLALVALGRVEEAAGHFLRATELRPDYVEAHFNLGRCLKEMGKPGEAIRQFREVLRYKPHHLAAHLLLADLLQQEGKQNLAREYLEQALSLDPDNQEARARLKKLTR